MEEKKEESNKANHTNHINNINNYKCKGIDYNCDLGQSYGVYQNEKEYELIDYVSSVNISCGFHSADPLTIRKALRKSKEKNVSIGAHVGFNDIQGFGYRRMELSESEIESIVIYQIGALKTFAKSEKIEIEHVRLHGAMYQMAQTDYRFAKAVAEAIKKIDKWLIYIAPLGEITERIEEETDLRIAKELIIDGVYDERLFLDNRMKLDKEKMIHRVKAYLQHCKIHIMNGDFINIDCDTIHFSDLEVLKKASEIIKPISVNYNQVKDSGWV